MVVRRTGRLDHRDTEAQRRHREKNSIVIPAKAGIHAASKPERMSTPLDPRFRGDDGFFSVLPLCLCASVVNRPTP